MATKTIITCDRCGGTLKHEAPTNYSFVTLKINNSLASQYHKDLCSDCTAGLLQWLRPEPPKPPEVIDCSDQTKVKYTVG